MLTNHGPQFRIEALSTRATAFMVRPSSKWTSLARSLAPTQDRNPVLAGLTDEEFKVLDAATRKMAMVPEAPALLPNKKKMRQTLSTKICPWKIRSRTRCH
jgi:hypothetical protein